MQQRSSTLKRQVNALQHFENCFLELLKTLNGDEEVVGSDGAEDYTERLRRVRKQTAEASGPAAQATANAGTLMQVAARGGTITLNPVQAWTSSLDGSMLIEAQDVLDAARQARGILEQRFEMASLRERSMAGRVAHVLSFPMRVRDLMGYSAGSVAGKTAVGFVAALQAAIATAIATAIVRGAASLL